MELWQKTVSKKQDHSHGLIIVMASQRGGRADSPDGVGISFRASLRAAKADLAESAPLALAAIGPSPRSDLFDELKSNSELRISLEQYGSPLSFPPTKAGEMKDSGYSNRSALPRQNDTSVRSVRRYIPDAPNIEATYQQHARARGAKKTWLRQSEMRPRSQPLQMSLSASRPIKLEQQL